MSILTQKLGGKVDFWLYSRYVDIATARREHSVSIICSKLRGTVNMCVMQYPLLATWWEYVLLEYDSNYVMYNPGKR